MHYLLIKVSLYAEQKTACLIIVEREREREGQTQESSTQSCANYPLKLWTETCNKTESSSDGGDILLRSFSVKISQI